MRIDIHKIGSNELISSVTTETDAEIKLKKQVARKQKNGEKVDAEYIIKVVHPVQDNCGDFYEVRHYDLVEVKVKESFGYHFLRYLIVLSGYLMVFVWVIQVGMNDQKSTRK